MTYGDLKGRTLWGRPVKPVPIGLIALALIVGLDLGGATRLIFHAPVSSVWSLAAAALMIIAWWPRSQRLYEVGLLLAVGAWASRSVEIWLLGHPPTAAIWACLAWIALGTYWLERTSHNDGLDEPRVA